MKQTGLSMQRTPTGTRWRNEGCLERSCRRATLRPASLSDLSMCAFPFSFRAAADRPSGEANWLRLPSFLSRGTGDLAQGALVGGAIAAGAALLGVAAVAAVMSDVRRSRARRLRGKIVLITGSSRGLGLAMAEEFARLGARIVLTARDQDELERARQWLLASDTVEGPEQVLVIPADLRKQEEAEYLVHRVAETWGEVDVLVNNAGVITVGPVESQQVRDFHEVMDSNFFTGLHCTMAVLPKMLDRRRGSIVNITSIGGKVAVPHLLPYTASKFAAVGFSEGLHAELRSKGVHVLTVCPGLMRTGSHLNAVFSGDPEREYRWFSLGATLPGASVSARRAARRIVRAVLARETEIAITLQAAMVARLAPLAPGVTAMGMSIANRFLPVPQEKGEPRRGAEVRGREAPTASSIGWSAAQRYNEIGGNTGA